jgi:hypothetical protein
VDHICLSNGVFFSCFRGPDRCDGASSKAADEDPLWRAMQANESVPYMTSGFPGAVFEAWSRTPEFHTPGERVDGHLYPDRLVLLRKVLLGRPLMREADMIKWGEDVCEVEQARMLQFNAKRKRGEKDKGNGERERIVGKEKALAAAVKMAGREREMNEEVIRATRVRASRKENEEEGDVDDWTEVGSSVDFSVRDDAPSIGGMRSKVLPNAALLARSPLAPVRVGSTVSSKLNYILNEVRRVFSPFVHKSHRASVGGEVRSHRKIPHILTQPSLARTRDGRPRPHLRPLPTTHGASARAVSRAEHHDVRDMRYVQGVVHGFEAWGART